jgi:hypothetical protein
MRGSRCERRLRPQPRQQKRVEGFEGLAGDGGSEQAPGYGR